MMEVTQIHYLKNLTKVTTQWLVSSLTQAAIKMWKQNMVTMSSTLNQRELLTM